MQETTQDKDIFKEFDQHLKDIKLFLRKRVPQLQPTQIKIILMQHADQLKIFTNNLLNSSEYDVEQRAGGFVRFLPEFRSILNMIPPYKELELVTVKLNTLNNLMISGFSLQNLSIDENTNMYSQATLLSNLLTGVPRIIFTPKSIDNPSKAQLEINRTYFNAIQITSGLYINALQKAYLMGLDDVLGWIREIIYHYELYLEFVKIIDLKQLWALTSNNYDEFYFRLWATLLPSAQLSGILGVQSITCDISQQKVDLPDFLYDQTELTEFSQQVEDLVKSKVDEVNDMYKRGEIDVNARPDDFQYYHLIKMIQFNLSLNPLSIRALTKNITGFGGIDLLFQFIQQLKGFLSLLIDIAGGRDKAMTSSWGPTILGYATLYIGSLGLLSVKREEVEFYETNIKPVEFIFDKQSLSTIPFLALIRQLTELYVFIELKKDLDLRERRVVLIDISQQFNSQPQQKVACEVLIVILSHLIEDTSLISLEENLLEIEMYIIQKYGLIHLVDDFTIYRQYLRNTFASLTTQPLPIMRQDVCELDLVTWLRPNFSKLVNDQYIIAYLPFNRQRDRIFDPTVY